MLREKGMFWYEYYDVKPKYNKGIKPLLRKIEKWLRKHDLVGDAFFCAPNVWTARGETYCTKSEAVIVFDGSSMYYMLNGMGYGRLNDEFYEFLQSEGYYLELGCAWYGGLYKI